MCLFSNPARCCSLKGTIEMSPSVFEVGAQNVPLASAIQPVFGGVETVENKR